MGRYIAVNCAGEITLSFTPKRAAKTFTRKWAGNMAVN